MHGWNESKAKKENWDYKCKQFHLLQSDVIEHGLIKIFLEMCLSVIPQSLDLVSERLINIEATKKKQVFDDPQSVMDFG